MENLGIFVEESRPFFEDIEVIAAGGLHQDKTEIYSLQRSSWFNGPDIQDRPIFKAATLQGINTFILTGGVELDPHCTTNDCRLSSIYAYDASLETFLQENQRLDQGRGNHVAVPLPVDIECSSKRCIL